MNVLITGYSGFLGRHLLPKLVENGFTIFFCNTKIGNLMDVKNLYVFNETKFDYIFHLACHTKAGDYCLYHKGEQWEINQTINTNILKYWKEFQPQAKMVCMGTSCSYAPYIEMKEDNYLKGEPDQGLYTYAMTKRMLLVGLKSYAEQFGLKYLHFIPSTLYGPEFDLNDSHFIFDLIKKIYSGKNFGTNVELWGNGYQKRELIYVKDAVNIIVSLLNKENESYNLGTGKEFSIREYAGVICNAIGYDPSKIVYDETKYVGVKSKKLSVEKLKSVINTLEFTEIQPGIYNTINYYTEKMKI